MPLRFSFPIKLIIEYRPDDILVEYAHPIYATDPELATDDIVKARGWDQRPGYKPEHVWVDGAF